MTTPMLIMYVIAVAIYIPIVRSILRDAKD